MDNEAPEERSLPARSPEEIHSLVQTAFNRGDAQALIELYEPEGVLVIDGKNIVGRENLLGAFETILSRSGRMTLETQLIIDSGQGLAVLHGKWMVEYPSEPRLTRGISTEVVRRQPNGTWLFAIDNPNSPL
jgi:uncharacterized protein (TIGR02246 family)